MIRREKGGLSSREDDGHQVEEKKKIHFIRPYEHFYLGKGVFLTEKAGA